MLVGEKMEKNILTCLLTATLVLSASAVQAQIYRYNPQTGKSDDVSSPPKPIVKPTAPGQPAQPARPTVSAVTQGGAKKAAQPPSAETLNKLKQVVAEEKAKEAVAEEGSSTDALITAVNNAIAKEEQAESRPMLPLGRVGIIIDPKQYNETIDRNIAQLKTIPDLDKLFMTPPIPMTSFSYLMQWKKIQGTEFIVDTGNMVQKKFGLTKVPGFIYLRPDGTSSTYSLDDLAPFFEALTVQRRKVGK